jgi:hypothetical protein
VNATGRGSVSSAALALAGVEPGVAVTVTFRLRSSVLSPFCI